MNRLKMKLTPQKKEALFAALAEGQSPAQAAETALIEPFAVDDLKRRNLEFRREYDEIERDGRRRIVQFLEAFKQGTPEAEAAEAAGIAPLETLLDGHSYLFGALKQARKTARYNAENSAR